MSSNSSQIPTLLDNSNSTWNAQVAGTPPPSVNGPPSLLPSVFRPFGHLPGKSLAPDETFAVLSFAVAAAAFCFALFAYLVVRIIKNRPLLSHKKVRQVPNFAMMAASCLFMIMCLTSIADATCQYPSPQSLWGQGFSAFGYIGVLTCMLTPLFYKPLGAKMDKASHFKEIAVMVVNGIAVLVLAVLEVVVIALNQSAPRALLLAVFGIKLAILVIFALVGTFTLVDAKLQQMKDLPADVPSSEVNILHTGGIALGRRMIAFGIGFLFLVLFTLVDSFESPALIMRGVGIISIFAMMITTVLISWSIFTTIVDKKMATDWSEDPKTFSSKTNLIPADSLDYGLGDTSQGVIVDRGSMSPYGGAMKRQ